MAEETDLSRTEPASPRRLQEARSAGDVPRSAELTAWVALLSALGMLGWQAPRLLEALQALTSAAFIHAAQPLSPAFVDAAHAALWAVLPVLAASFVAALVAPMLLSGWVFAPHVTQMDLRRASPFKPFSRLLSQDALFDALAMLLKLLLVAAAVWWVLASGWNALLAADSRTALNAFAGWIGRGVLAVAVVAGAGGGARRGVALVALSAPSCDDLAGSAGRGARSRGASGNPGAIAQPPAAGRAAPFERARERTSRQNVNEVIG